MATLKKRLAIVLAVCLVVMNTVPAFAAVDNEPQTDNTKTESTFENDADVEIASPSNAETEEITEEEPVEEEEAEFFGEAKVGNVIITAKAAAGVVPKGTELWAAKVVDKKVNEAIDEVVEEKREDEAQVVESLKFDIQLRYNGEEIEPKGLVSIDFAFADAVANAEANIYHILEDEETKELVEAEVLEVEKKEEVQENANEPQMVLETEVPGFSYYVVEFTVGEYQYVLEGDKSVKLSEILDELNIEGTVTKAVSGAPELFSVEKDAAGDDWTVTALEAFSTEEWLKVTIDGKEYKIIVTDSEKGTFSTLQTVINSYSSPVPLQLDKDYEAQSGEGAITIESGKSITIDLNGHTIDRGLNSATSDGSVIIVKGTLTVEDKSTAGTGKITGGNNIRNGGGVYIWSGGTFTLNGGSIENNEINNNTSNGGGVYVGGTFIMTGGSITNNRANGSAACGGGVYVGGTFTMTGGNITSNSAGKDGGGVYFNNGTVPTSFKMTGGGITNNTATLEGGGVFINTTTGIMTVGGNAKITGNFKGTVDTKTANNAYIPINRYITIETGSDAPENGMGIGVTSGDTVPVKITTNGTADDVKYFSADQSNQYVQFVTDHLELCQLALEYKVQFLTDGDVYEEQTVKNGEKAIKPADPTKQDCDFAGWYTDVICADGTEYDFNTPVTADITIYAKWIAATNPDPTPKKKNSQSASVYTGTWGNAVSNGNWTQDANGVWSYTTIRKFTNTWGYIANPYAGGQPSWFYFDAYGNMLTGWQFIQGKWYYLNPSKDGTLGACQLGGVTPDGWTVDESGAWVENIPKK